MRTKSHQQRKVNIVTLGCAKNTFDSEVLLKQLHANNFDARHENVTDTAEIVVINTCGFIETAKQQSIDTILNFATAKKQGQVEQVYVTGCLSERYKDDLQSSIPEIDAWFGTRELPRLLKTLKADYKKELIGERLLATPAHYAYFKISEGCDRPCSFCAIPLMRGKHISTPMPQLLENAKQLAANGTKELLLIAQDSTYYGLDIYKKRCLAELLENLAKIDGIEWIRLHYAFPSGFPEDILDVMSCEPKICNYLDMPLQHISNNILRAMRRGITQEKTYRLLDKIKSKIPDIALRTTFLVGYPGETEKDFEALVNFVKDVQFDRLGVFAYSHEEDTHAFNQKDNIPENVKQERANILMETQLPVSDAINQKKVGRILPVMVDGFRNGSFYGRTEADSPDVDNEVIIKTKQNDYLSPGKMVKVKITAAAPYDLTGAAV